MTYLNGPWDATVADHGDTATLFVTTTLNGVKDAGGKVVNHGTVVRLELSQTPTKPPVVTSHVIVADTLPEQEDASAFVKGPTGLVLDPAGVLYVGDNVGNRDRRSSPTPSPARTRRARARHSVRVASSPTRSAWTGPLTGTCWSPTPGTARSSKSPPLEHSWGSTSPTKTSPKHPPGNGDLFDIAVNQTGNGIYFVNDDTNVLSLLHE